MMEEIAKIGVPVSNNPIPLAKTRPGFSSEIELFVFHLAGFGVLRNQKSNYQMPGLDFLEIEMASGFCPDWEKITLREYLDKAIEYLLFFKYRIFQLEYEAWQRCGTVADENSMYVLWNWHTPLAFRDLGQRFLDEFDRQRYVSIVEQDFVQKTNRTR